MPLTVGVDANTQLAFPRQHLSIPLSSLFDVKVGAVSGADPLFEHPEGNCEFVCSKTIDTGQTRRMIYNVLHPALIPHKNRLLQRRVRTFDETNWWMWGRTFHHAPHRPRIYVNEHVGRPHSLPMPVKLTMAPCSPFFPK